MRAMACSRYTGFREITDRDVLELHCILAKRVTCCDREHNQQIRDPSTKMLKVSQNISNCAML